MHKRFLKLKYAKKISHTTFEGREQVIVLR